MKTSRNYLEVLFSVFCLVVPTVSILSSNALVPMILVVAVAAVVLQWRQLGGIPRPEPMMTMALGTLLAWALFTSIWAFNPGSSILLVLRLGALFMAALLLFSIAGQLPSEARSRIARWLIFGLALGAFIMVEEFATDQFLRRLPTGIVADDVKVDSLNRGATALAMIVWPVTAILWRQGLWHRRLRVWALLLPLATTAGLSLLASGAAVLGAIAGFMFALISLTHPKAGRVLLTIIVVAGFAAAPWIAEGLFTAELHKSADLAQSIQHRIYIWNFVAERIAEHPIIGWGFDASRDMPNFGVVPFDRVDGDTLPLHPHNAALQIWLELGAVGIVISLVTLLLVIRRIEHLADSDRVCAQALFMTTLVIASSAYGLWQNKWIALMLSVALLMVLIRDRPGDQISKVESKTGPS